VPAGGLQGLLTESKEDTFGSSPYPSQENHRRNLRTARCGRGREFRSNSLSPHNLSRGKPLMLRAHYRGAGGGKSMGRIAWTGEGQFRGASRTLIGRIGRIRPIRPISPIPFIFPVPPIGIAHGMGALRYHTRRVTVHSPAFTVIPAKAGIQSRARLPSPAYWIPAFAGMTVQTRILLLRTGFGRRERLPRRYEQE